MGASFSITRAIAMLALAAGELDAALADVGVVAAPALGVGQAEDELVRLGRFFAAAIMSASVASGRP